MKQTVLITGASRGIGAALALELSKKDYNIAIDYNSSKKKAEEIAKTCNGNCYHADVSNPAEIESMIKQIGNIDILINNAGISSQKLFLDITDEEWKNVFDINLFGAVSCIKAVLPQMLSRNAGKIINISSVHGLQSAACEAAYSASKSALIGLTTALSAELTNTNIEVTHIPLPAVDTNMHKKLMEDYKVMTGFDFEENIPLLTPLEAANLIIEQSNL